jgi:prephenate dehydrogenase
VFRQLGVIGCGLIGGSFALALRRAGAVQRVVGCSRTLDAARQAVTLGVLDEAMPTPQEAAAGCDLVLIAVPVSATEDALRAIRPVLAPGVLCMDVGSTKSDVVAAARRALGEAADCFVPAHPIAGKETAGVQHADASLFKDREVILTPTGQSDPDRVRLAQRTWQAAGARVRTLTPEAHDEAYAAVSHLPHLLAFAYYLAVARSPQGEAHLSLAGPGFRDFTRIAGSDPDVWRDILLANAPRVLAAAAEVRRELDAFERAMREGDAQALSALLQAASTGRRGWQRPDGSTLRPGQRETDIHG